MPNAAALIPLSELSPGEASTIVSIADDGAHRRRLLELGFVPGTRIAVERRAPLGDPTVYVIRGSRVALRSRLARLINTGGPEASSSNGDGAPGDEA